MSHQKRFAMLIMDYAFLNDWHLKAKTAPAGAVFLVLEAILGL
jgi:hypothetical protein